MVNSLEELVQNRRDLIEAHRKNDFTDGIHALLTDLYPDTAHFIYELLQNAEDMNATAVRFILSNDKVQFEHNGTKRDFTIADIDAITNIGHNSLKKEDPTSIGKFGVGFKAVFAYTTTPEIHSGQYHFRICNYFVPEFENVPKLNTIDSNGVKWTIFVFPFNHKTKSRQNALTEVMDGLKKLENTSLLFLKNIKSIEYTLPNGQSGFIHASENDQHVLKIEYRSPNRFSANESKWLRFQKTVNIIDDQKNRKILNIAIAYSLGYDEKKKAEIIVPVQGRTFIYFPAEKESSGLRFHINAPFASTVARDSVRDCTENNKLMDAVANLVSESLSIVLSQGYMTMDFFGVLPNNHDELSDFYDRIRSKVQAAFKTNSYLPAKGTNERVTALNALIGPASISRVITNTVLHSITGSHKRWIENAPQRNSNEDYFLHSLDIEEYSYSEFVKVFTSNESRTRIEAFVKGLKTRDLQEFYVLCGDALDALPSSYFGYSERSEAKENMTRCKMIRSQKGLLYTAREIYILPPNTALITQDTPIVLQDLIVRPNRSGSDKIYQQVQTFFQDDLKIEDYGPKIEIEKKLKRYRTTEWDIDESYYDDLLAFAKYSKNSSDINFEDIEFFLYEKAGKLYASTASELVMGANYGFDIGTEVATATGKKLLWKGYEARFGVGKESLKLVLDFATQCGVLASLSIIKQDSRLHPEFYSKLFSSAKRTDYENGVDYTIPGLEDLLKKPSLKVSKTIWGLLAAERQSSPTYYGYSSNKHPKAEATYAPNASTGYRRCESSLVYYLKNAKWIPDKTGKFHKPEDIKVEDLPTEFAYDASNTLLLALEIGSRFKAEIQKMEDLKQQAESQGCKLVSEEEYREFQEFKAAKERRAQSRDSKEDVAGLLQKQTRKQKQTEDEDDYSSDGTVGNVSKREKALTETFTNTQQMSNVEKTVFSHVAESNKEEKEFLRSLYKGKCQMCGTMIRRHDGTPHFVACNIINTRDVPGELHGTISLGWNSLCLCPNCAAKYKVCARDISGMGKQISGQTVFSGDPEPKEIMIQLEGKPVTITYAPKHFLALQVAFRMIDSMFEKDKNRT